MSERLFENDWAERLQKRHEKGQLRRLPDINAGTLDFSSNDYLGLRQNHLVLKAGIEAAEKYGAGSGASRLVSGNYPLLEELETALASWMKKEAALVFSSGWQMNVSVLSAIAGKGDAIIVDRLAHNSLLRGSYCSGATVFRFKHNDVADAKRCVNLAEKEGLKRKLLLTESVFSMDGDFCPFVDLRNLAAECGALFVVDEAHALGVYGNEGAGFSAQFQGKQPDMILGTFGKSLGTQGGFVACSELAKSFLLNFADGFIYSTAPVPFVAGATLQSLQISRKMDLERDRLKKNAARLASEIGLDVATTSHIVPFLVGSEENLQTIKTKLLNEGIQAGFIRPPTVPENASRVRISLNATHTEHDTDRLSVVLKSFPFA